MVGPEHMIGLVRLDNFVLGTDCFIGSCNPISISPSNSQTQATKQRKREKLMEILSAVSGCSNISCCLLLKAVKQNECVPKGDANQAPLKLKQVEQVKEILNFKNLAPPLVAAVIALSPICNTQALAQTVDIQRGATLFGQACIGCHDGGGNIIQPGATLFTKDLERNGVNTEEEIYRVTYYGKGRMPGFGESCTPRGQCTFGPRLKENEIKLLAEFVKLQADQGWPNIASNS